MTEASEAAERGDRDGILDGLNLRIRPAGLPVTYRIGILLVAIVMVVLPMIYVGLIAASAYGIYWHATENATILSADGSIRGRLLVYSLPIAVGVILLFFMVKPFFAPRAVRSGELEVDPEEDPFLFEFVDRLCRAVGAPEPRRIILDCQVNASAGFHQGGFFTRGRELTIGLPLVAGMTLREFTGVLAHEFGHFGQGVGMRVSFVVNSVNFWFARVVHERDQWDEKLVAWGKSGIGYLIALSAVARLFVWITRRILVGLMWIGRAVSSYLSRQMEYDADRYTVHIVGNDALESSMRRLPHLSVGSEMAGQRLSTALREGRLPDNLPRFILAQTRGIPEEICERIDQGLDEEPKYLFATHPRTVDRIAAADEMDVEGCFAPDGPASSIFADFDSACRAATEAHFNAVLGRHFSQIQLTPTAAFIGEQAQAEEEREVLSRYLRGAVNVVRPLPIGGLEPAAPDDPQATGLRIKELRRTVVETSRDYAECLEGVFSVHNQLVAYEIAGARLEGGLQVDPDDFALPEISQPVLSEARQQVQAELEQLDGAMRDFESACAERLAAALNMLRVPKVAGRLENGSQLLADVERLLPCAKAVASVLADLVHLRADAIVVGDLSGVGAGVSDKLKRVLRKRGVSIKTRADEVWAQLGDVAYPFERTNEDLMLIQVAYVPTDGKNMGERGEAAMSICDTLCEVYVRLLARIAAIAEQVEGALGFKPLPVLKELAGQRS